MTPEYLAAIDAHNAALRAYDLVLTAYRAGKMEDADFLKHRAIKVAADKAFDLAFTAEQDAHDSDPENVVGRPDVEEE